jgi:hypothetical protein
VKLGLEADRAVITLGGDRQVGYANSVQVTSLSGSSRANTGVSKPTLGGVCGSTAGEGKGLQVAQRVQGGGDRGGTLGAAAGSAEAITASGNVDADEAESMAWSGNSNNSVDASLGVVVESTAMNLGQLHHFIGEMLEEHYCVRAASSARANLFVAKGPHFSLYALRCRL